MFDAYFVFVIPALLHLAPNSPEAKVFTDVAKALAPASSTTATSTGKLLVYSS